jgi:DNA-binding NtrC family response regulator
MNVAENFAVTGNIPSPPLSVLVVDDEMLIRWSVSEILSDVGHRVVEADSAEGALKAVASARQPFDVVLLDYRLPDSNGLGLLATIRETLPESAIVLMTAYGTPEVARDARSLGAYDVLDKPFDMHGLDSLVRNAYAAARH